MNKTTLASISLALLSMSACTSFDRAAGTDTSGVYPAQRNGTAINPSGTAATRTLDRAAGTDVSGAYPAQRDGTPGNPPGTAVGRAYDRVTGSDVSGAYPQNQRPASRSY
jgi:hypothetical protein